MTVSKSAKIKTKVKRKTAQGCKRTDALLKAKSDYINHPL